MGSQKVYVNFDSPESTYAWGRCLGQILKPPLLLALDGQLGAGKTHLTQGIVAGYLGEGAPWASSPTYVLQHIYVNNGRRVYHLDAYRLDGSPEEWQGAGLDETLRDPDAIVCVEWAARVRACLPREGLEIALEVISEASRRASLSAYGAHAMAVLKAVRESWLA
jgi:tRNA threonylcarbamoyladenosine biosynthesis protein TsaE